MEEDAWSLSHRARDGNAAMAPIGFSQRAAAVVVTYEAGGFSSSAFK